jgi:hypothetical protein
VKPRRALTLVCLVVLVACLVVPVFAADAAKKKAKKKGKKAYDYENSRYKAYHELSDSEPRTYRFDARGNPIPPPGSKKKGAKGAKKASSDAPAAEEEKAASEEPAAESCSPGESCGADGAKAEKTE